MKRKAAAGLILAGALLVSAGLVRDGVRLYRRNARAPMSELKHTEYDPLLGWINVPGFHVPDFYGPGLGLRTNSQRFRADQDFSGKVPPGKTRVICSGDSFTLGFGVGDADTWCRRLSDDDASLETVNMGQGGYGVDQAYLWYKRDGARLESDIHLFAFIGDDFRRMRFSSFCGYSKPLLRASRGALTVTNVPVPRASRRLPWLFQAAEARVTWLLEPAMDRLRGKGLSDEEEREISLGIFDDLGRIDSGKKSSLIFVYLPVLEEYRDGVRTPVRDFLRELARTGRIRLFDLTDDLDRVPAPEVASLFDGHYSRKGNAFIAENLLRRLREGGFLRAPLPRRR